MPLFPAAFVGGGSSTLLNGLSYFYNCDEGGTGDLIDVLGATNLTAINAPGSAAGLINTSRTFTIAGTKTFYATGAPVITTGAAFSGAFWYYSTDATNFLTAQTFISNLDNGVNGGFDIRGRQIAGSYNVTFRTQATGVASDLNLQPTVSPFNAWTWIYFEWNPVTGNKTLRHRQGVVNEVAVGAPGAVPTTSAPRGLEVSGSGVAATMEGRMDMIGGWSARILTSAEQTELFNSGVGKQL